MKLPYGQTITVIRRGERDRYGDYEPDSTHEIDNVGIAWESTTDDGQFREATDSGTVLYMPRGADILPTDKVQLPDDSVWSVIGRPQWGQRHPMTGWQPDYKSVRIREVGQ